MMNKKEVLVGYTGFVGSNICLSHRFDGLYNSKNITEAYGTNPDLMVYSGVPAEMFIANNNPNQDLMIIEQAIENIKKINSKKVVLISTIAVFHDSVGKDEDSKVDSDCLNAYGRNRYYLENWVENNCSEYLIVRLPGLYGAGLKKNFIYDYIHKIPVMLNETKYKELREKENNLEKYYYLQENGFYKCKADCIEDKIELKTIFYKVGFSAINFTDSRGIYQYYNLNKLWKHIETALLNNITKLHLAVEPISAGELYFNLTSEKFVNYLPKDIPKFDYRTKYSEIFGGKNGYIYTADDVISDVTKFISDEMTKEWGENEVINF